MEPTLQKMFSYKDGAAWNMPLQGHKGRLLKVLYIENYLPYRVSAQLILSRGYIFLKDFKGCAVISHNIQRPSAEKYTSHIPYFRQKTGTDDEKPGLIMSIIILDALPVTCTSIPPLLHAPMFWAISYRAVHLHINHANNISPWFFTQQDVMSKLFYHFCNHQYLLSVQVIIQQKQNVLEKQQ